MTENLYLADVVTKGETTTIDPFFITVVNRSISIRPAEPEDKYLKYYMDLLYYNRVNSLGDILTSLVYVGDFRESTPDNTFTYTPDNMFRQTVAEKYISISDSDVSFPGYNHLVEHDTLPLYSEPSDYEVLSRDGKLSNTLGPIDIAFDGWYTLVTVSVTDRGLYGEGGSDDGELTWVTPNNYVPYQSTTNGMIDLREFSNEDLLIGQLPYNTTIYNTYKKQDFFVIYDFKELYKQELEKDIKSIYKDSYNSIIEKGRVLEYLLSTGDFMTSQQLLQTVEDSVLLNVLI